MVYGSGNKEEKLGRRKGMELHSKKVGEKIRKLSTYIRSPVGMHSKNIFCSIWTMKGRVSLSSSALIL